MSEEKQIRILSLDGAGIYGLTQALWLRQLCEEDADFLKPGNVGLFAGCSAGAINSLLLAMADNPREVVCDGVLEAFWTDRGTFSNTDPVAAWLSFFGIGALGSAEDFLSLLKRYMGDRKLDSLPQKVLVTTFNWSCSRGNYTQRAFPDDNCRPAGAPGCRWPASPFDLGQGFTPPWLHAHEIISPTVGPAQKGQADSWGPNIFTNLDVSDHPTFVDSAEHWYIVDIAYGAASPAGWRPIRNGLSDAGLQFGANPVLNAIGAMVQCEKSEHEREPADTLRAVSALSLGTGGQQPYYWLENFNLSSHQFASLPTNPLRGHWSPPTSAVMIQGPVENTDLITEQLLPTSFLRLNPGILQMSAGEASLVSYTALGQQWMIDQIRAAVRSPRSKESVRVAVDFLKSAWKTDTPSPAPSGP